MRDGTPMFILVVDAFTVFMVVCLLRYWRQWWRNEVALRYDYTPSGWWLGRAIWRGWVRVLTAVGQIWLISTAVWWLLAANGQLVGAQDSPVVVVGAPAAIAISSICLVVLIPLVILFNRPRFLVAPHLRHQPGAIAEWRGAKAHAAPPPGREMPY